MSYRVYSCTLMLNERRLSCRFSEGTINVPITVHCFVFQFSSLFDMVKRKRGLIQRNKIRAYYAYWSMNNTDPYSEEGSHNNVNEKN